VSATAIGASSSPEFSAQPCVTQTELGEQGVKGLGSAAGCSYIGAETRRGGLVALAPLVKQAFEQEFINPDWLDFADFEEDLRASGPDPQRRAEHDIELLFGDTVEKLSEWAYSDDDEDDWEPSERGDDIEMPSAKAHAMAHVVETQIAEGDALPVRRTLERLMREGLDRHDAVHAIGMVLMTHIHDLLEAGDAEGNPKPKYFAEWSA
jgi:hypothetical protein